MRLVILAAASALALGACNKETEMPVAHEPAAEPAAAPAAAAHDMGAMDHDMAAMDTADDANTAETPDGHTFHTYPDKTEMVHLPAAGEGFWTATPTAGADFVAVGAAEDKAMPDGAMHHVVMVKTIKSGNADVMFERRDTAEAAAPVVETRTVHFMIH